MLDAVKPAAYSAVEWASNIANAVDAMNNDTNNVKTINLLQFDWDCDDDG